MPRPPKAKTFVNNMIERHGTSDLLEIMVSEVNQGNYANAEKVFGHLDAAQANSPKTVIYRMRALAALGNSSALKAYVSSHNINDGEFLLARARIAYQASRISEARELLDRALKSPRQFMGSAKLRQDVYYYQALCSSSAFDAEPSEACYKAALDAWWQVRNEMRASPEHQYNKKAGAKPLNLTGS